MRRITTVILTIVTLLTALPSHMVYASPYNYIPSVVEIYTYGTTETGEWYGATGTGFFINWDGALLTNYHVIEDSYYGGISDIILICTVENEYSESSDCNYTAYTWAYDIERDLALLFPMEELDDDWNVVSDVTGTFYTEDYLNISNWLPELSEDIFILGFPDADLSGGITLTEGIVSGFTGDWFITDAIVNPGNSGGPVFSYYDEKVLGVATAVTTSGIGGNYGYAISNDAIYDWFYELVDAGILNVEFVDEMFADDTGYETGEEIFSDVEMGDDNSEAIAYLRDTGIIDGYPDGSFKPNRSLNRAELLKILVEGAGYSPSEDDYSDCFPDVETDWYAKYVCFAEDEGWIEGYPDGTFKPAQDVNKVEAIKMLLEVLEVDLENAKSDPFEDVASSEWYADYIQTAKDWGLLEETNYYDPSDSITRGGISENLYRLLVALYD